MKMGLIVTGLLGAGLFVLSFDCRADQRAGQPGAGVRRGYAGPRSGPVFRERFGLRPPRVSAGNQNATGFGYPYRNRSSAHSGRFFSRRNRLSPVAGFAITTFGFPWVYPYGYDDGELEEAPAYGVATVTNGGSEANDPGVVVQPVIVQRFYPQSTAGQAIRPGSDLPQERKESPPDPAGTRQPQSVAPEQAAPPQAGPAVAVPSPTARAQAGAFAAFVLVSWHQEDGKTAALIENTDTNAVQEVTKEANGDNLRIVTIHPSANPKLSEVVISNGTEQGVVKFPSDPATVGTRRQ